MAIENATLVPNKNHNSLLERGFKTRTENISATIRGKLGIGIDAPLSYIELAKYLGVDLIELADVQHLSSESKDYLASSEGDEWSAVTVANPERVIIVSNPNHSDARRSSSIMHELSHIILEHDPGKVYLIETSLALRDYNEKQEAEADWLAATLLLPREALLTILRKGTPKEIALSQFTVSSVLFEFRLNKTIPKHFRRR